MKKIVLILVAIFAICVSASAQRRSVPYGGIGVISNFDDKTGAGATVGFRNYNINSFVSVGLGGEAHGYFIPASKNHENTVDQFGVFGIPEIGVAIGPNFFKVYPHTALMFGYDSYNQGFYWGGKNGLAFDFGKHFTLDFSTYAPKYNYSAVTYAINFFWRF